MENKRLKLSRVLAAIEVKGVTNFSVTSNQINDSTNNNDPIYSNGLVIGSCDIDINESFPTAEGVVKNNFISLSKDIENKGFWPLILRGTSDIRFKGNKPANDPLLDCNAEEPI